MTASLGESSTQMEQGLSAKFCLKAAHIVYYRQRFNGVKQLFTRITQQYFFPVSVVKLTEEPAQELKNVVQDGEAWEEVINVTFRTQPL